VPDAKARCAVDGSGRTSGRTVRASARSTLAHSDWLDEATKTIGQHCRRKNDRSTALVVELVMHTFHKIAASSWRAPEAAHKALVAVQRGAVVIPMHRHGKGVADEGAPDAAGLYQAEFRLQAGSHDDNAELTARPRMGVMLFIVVKRE